MANDREDQQTFRFFELPRELRDMVYDELKQDERSVLAGRVNPTSAPRDYASLKPSNIGAQLRFGPVSDSLILNHEFKSEYSPRVQGSQVLTFLDLPAFNQEPFELDPRLRQVNHLELRLALALRVCHHGPQSDPECLMALEVRDHLGWLTHLIPQLHRVHTTSLTLRTGYDSALSTAILQKPGHDRLREDLHSIAKLLPGLRQAEILHAVGNRKPQEGLAEEDLGSLCMVWSAVDGWQDVLTET